MYRQMMIILEFKTKVYKDLFRAGKNTKRVPQVSWNVADKWKVMKTVDWLGMKTSAFMNFMLFC